MTNDEIHDAIVELLVATKRKGIKNLIKYLEGSDFFITPASTIYHGCTIGGLARHSYGVFNMLSNLCLKFDVEGSAESIVVAGLLHDVCKIGAYIKTDKGWKWNKGQPKGHALLSLNRISEYIKLTDLEDKIIRYHMGVYGLKEFDARKGEYELRNKQMANAWYHHPIVKVMYFCDELVSLGE